MKTYKIMLERWEVITEGEDKDNWVAYVAHPDFRGMVESSDTMEGALAELAISLKVKKEYDENTKRTRK